MSELKCLKMLIPNAFFEYFFETKNKVSQSESIHLSIMDLELKTLILTPKKATPLEQEVLMDFLYDLLTLMKFSEKTSEFIQVYDNVFDLDFSIEERRLCFLRKAGQRIHNIPLHMLKDSFHIYRALLDIDELLNPKKEFSEYTLDLFKKCKLQPVNKQELKILFHSNLKKPYY